MERCWQSQRRSLFERKKLWNFKLMKTYQLYLSGEFVGSEKTIPEINPATGESFASISSIDRKRVAQAVKDAHAALKDWRKLTGKARGDCLNKIAAEVEHRREEVARIIT